MLRLVREPLEPVVVVAAEEEWRLVEEVLPRQLPWVVPQPLAGVVEARLLPRGQPRPEQQQPPRVLQNWQRLPHPLLLPGVRPRYSACLLFTGLISHPAEHRQR